MTKPVRRVLFIEREFQKRFIAKVIGIIVVGTLLTGGFMYLFGDYQISRMYSSAHVDIKSSWEVFRSAVLIASFVSMSLVAVLAVVLTLRESNRIGGPLYRFRENLKVIAGGDLTLHTKLRDGDELQPMASAMNEMTEGLCERVKGACVAADALDAATVAARGRPESDEAWQAVDGAAQTLREQLDGFRTSE